MRRIVIVMSLLAFAVMLTGCGSTMMAYNNVQKMKKRVDAEINLQNTPPDVAPLEQYAQSPLAKDLWKALNTYNTNPDSIPTKLMDPATDPEAAAQVEKDVAKAKAGIAKSFNKANKALYAQTMRSVEDSLRKPYYQITELPVGAYEGIIRDIKPMVAGAVRLKAGKSVYFRFDFEEKGIEAVRAEIIAALDEFLTKDGKWVKKADMMKQSNEKAAVTIRETIALTKKIIEENEKYPQRKAMVERWKRDLKKNENMLAYFEKQANSGESPITMYTYMWNEAGKIDLNNRADMFSVVLNIKDGNVTVAFNKMIYE